MIWYYFVPVILALLFIAGHLQQKKTFADWHQLFYTFAGIAAFFWIMLSLLVPMSERVQVFEHEQFTYTQNAGQTCIITNDGKMYASDKALVYTTISNPKSKVAVVQSLSEWGATVHSEDIRIIIQ